MVKKFKLLFILVALTVFTACGTDQATDDTANENIDDVLPLEVEILTDSDAFEPGVPGEIEAKVWQGDENVDDADEVVFEIWKDGHEDEAEELEGESIGDGIYTLTYTFEEDGIYYVIAHVTARGMHTMPKKEFIVGDVDGDIQTDRDDQEGHDHGEHGDGLTIHLMKPDTIRAGENAEWIVHLEQDGKPLTEAKVQLEYWQGDDKHEYVDATETNEGEYSVELQFPKSGQYEMTIHVVKDDLHEHKEEVIEVP